MNLIFKRRLVFVLALLTVPALLVMVHDARSDSDLTECFWSPVTKQCIPDEQLFIQPAADMAAAQTQLFEDGLKQFRAQWSVFPRIDGEWGLGPTFLASSCEGCHNNSGRGKYPDLVGKGVFQQLVRVSLPGADASGTPAAHPAYGDQIQVFSVFGDSISQPVTGEADVYVDWSHENKTLGDGTEVALRRPVMRIAKPAYGPLGESTMMSLRNTPVAYGLGYLDAVPDELILKLAAQQKAQGLNGRPNYVRDDLNGKISLGRFGWKANQPNLKQQVAAAHIGDMGITSSLYMDQNCPKAQTQCQAVPLNGIPELTQPMFDSVTLFLAGVEAPQRSKAAQPQFAQGEKLFQAVGYSGCHVPELKTGKYPQLPAIENKPFAAYTDLLLHDMGEDLADNRPDFKAGGRDWRTAPLWGIGLSKRVNGSTHFLHDGRARNVTEAILWHGGEAKKSRDQFVQLKKEERDGLLDFVNAL